MYQLLLVNNAGDLILFDTVNMYCQLLSLPVQITQTDNLATAIEKLRSDSSYDLMMISMPADTVELDILEHARQLQPGIRPLICSKGASGCVYTEDGISILPYPLHISAFYDTFSRLALDEPMLAPGKRSGRWLTNHDSLLESILTVLQVIRQEFMQDISLNDLADRVYFSPCYLSSMFTKFVGISPMAYVNQLRLKAAAELLLRTTDTVTQICHQVGFRNLPYFCTCFKQTYHMTPAQYREQHLKPTP